MTLGLPTGVISITRWIPSSGLGFIPLGPTLLLLRLLSLVRESEMRIADAIRAGQGLAADVQLIATLWSPIGKRLVGICSRVRDEKLRSLGLSLLSSAFVLAGRRRFA